MAAKKQQEASPSGGVTIQLHPAGLMIFSVALVAAAALVTYGLANPRAAARMFSQSSAGLDDSGNVVEAASIPAGGQLVVHDLDLEQPDEYVAYEIDTNKVETWTFEGMNPGAVRSAMQSCGLAAADIDRALSPASMVFADASTIVKPDFKLVLAMTPETRAKLYAVLADYRSDELMQFPFCFSGNTFATKFDRGKISGTTYSLLKKMMYPRGGGQCFSDLPALLLQVPEEKERMQLVKALSHQSALLVGIHVWPDTDVDKLVGYWAWPSGVRLINVRPLLESIQRRPGGGSASILYFLPPFARQRLYTYPLPGQLGDPAMDCHWSTMNFFNETPDNRFSDPSYTVAFLQNNYYKIARPTAYGDRIFLLDKKNNAIHSAVYLADDIVFTKNGNNSAQPWMLMHLKDLLNEFSSDAAPTEAVYRDKRW
jgi:hypothetical protein